MEKTLSYLRRIGVKKGDRALILGSGCRRLCFAAHCANAGTELAAMIGTPSRKDAAQNIGVNVFKSYKESSVYDELIKKFGLFDYIIDAVGTKGALSDALCLLKTGGACGVYGWYDWDTNYINPFAARDSFVFYSGGYDRAETHDDVVNFMKNKDLEPAHDACA